MNLELYA